ncbi:MAG TPA: ferritin family protein, partial [Woeseiaceae bacterium]|nr:ferritin family protein [Woeseiaceae bacterium]
FRELARMEKLHAESVLERAASLELPKLATSTYKWQYPEGPETADLHGVDTLMTPHHALSLALHNERRAADFFTQVAADAADGELAILAMKMAEEEQEHVRLIERWLGKYPGILSRE